MKLDEAQYTFGNKLEIHGYGGLIVLKVMDHGRITTMIENYIGT